MDMQQGLKAQVIILDLPQACTGPRPELRLHTPQLQWGGESVPINLLRFLHLFLLVHSESA